MSISPPLVQLEQTVPYIWLFVQQAHLNNWKDCYQIFNGKKEVYNVLFSLSYKCLKLWLIGNVLFY